MIVNSKKSLNSSQMIILLVNGPEKFWLMTKENTLFTQDQMTDQDFGLMESKLSITGDYMVQERKEVLLISNQDGMTSRLLISKMLEELL